MLGARTNRYGDFLDIAAAITGRVPEAGLHLTDARRATLVLRLADDVPERLRDDDALFRVLGIVLGRRAGSAVAAIEGLPAGQSEDRLKALGAAAASSGAVAMFHVVGSTPEAHLRVDEPLSEEIGIGELRAARDELTSAAGDGLAAISIGTPHASLGELETYAGLLAAVMSTMAWSCSSRPGATCSPRRRAGAWRRGCRMPVPSCSSTPAATSRRSSARPVAR